MSLKIVVTYTSIDHYHKRRQFATLAGAQKFAHNMVGPHPEIGYTFQYAVSGDGVGKVQVQGVSLDELFPAPVEVRSDPYDDQGEW